MKFENFKNLIIQLRFKNNYIFLKKIKILLSSIFLLKLIIIYLGNCQNY